jgi:hypothetical protein
MLILPLQNQTNAKPNQRMKDRNGWGMTTATAGATMPT